MVQIRSSGYDMTSTVAGFAAGTKITSESIQKAMNDLYFDQNRYFYVSPRHYGKSLMWSQIQNAKMWAYIPDEDKPEPKPEKSPADKALDGFIAKREAKRVRADELQAAGTHVPFAKTKRDNEVAEALDRACSKLSFHSQTIGARLAAYRGPDL